MIGSVLICPAERIFCSASTSATKPPVIEAVRVPPSAWMTSQSTQIVRSPSSLSFATERSDRPISRWISCVRPPTLPALASRWVRVEVARGSIPYSAVTQPLPWLRRNGGTRSSTLAVQITLVRPTSIKTDPSAWARKPGVIVVGRGCEGERPSMRVMNYNPFQALRERMPQVDVTCESVDFLAVDEDLHVGHGRQVDRECVDDGVDREDLVERSARMLRGEVAGEIDERVAAFGDEHVAHSGLGRDRRHQRRRRRDLRFDDGPR